MLIMSDSHGLVEEVQRIKERHADEVDAIIHCGDSELPINVDVMSGMYKVGGNCDIDNRFNEENNFVIGDLSFYVTHGHLHDVKRTLMPLSYRAEELGANVICFGHSHIAGAELVNNKLFINPGSIRLPRGIVEKTYATLYWEELSDATVEFYTDQGIVLPDLTLTVDLSAGE
ncbi:metallophosphoesterase [Pontibacillus litoralis]|uniref:metallophosphoesterase n=1 Tax=Pontibacillus litoralis TaxID=516703 RepID=UPI002FC34CA4